MLSPKIMLNQNAALLNTHFPLNNFVLCTATIGNCNIIATNPYPRNFFVIHPMINSCPRLEIKNVIAIAIELLKYVFELKYTWRRRKWYTGIFHSRLNSSQSELFHQSE